MGKHLRLLVILTISDGASDISGKCVRFLVYDPVSDICRASSCREPQSLDRDQVSVP